MAVQECELNQYRTSACDVVSRLGENPYELVESPYGYQLQAWMVRAIKMHELRLMLDEMRIRGFI